MPEALRAVIPSSPASSRNGQGGKQAIKSDEAQQQRNGNGESANQQLMQTQNNVPTPMMYIDPNMRIPDQGQHSQAQVQAQQAQAMASMPQQQLGRQTTDGLGLLLEAFDTHQGAAGMAAAAGDQPYDPSVVGTQGGYYGPTGAVLANDGYENELQFYIDGAGAPNVTAWIPGAGGPGMYGY